MYGFWRGNAAQTVRKCGNVGTARCPLGLAHSVFRGCLSSRARWAGDKRGHWEAGGWTKAWDQTAERQRSMVVGVGGQWTGRFFNSHVINYCTAIPRI